MPIVLKHTCGKKLLIDIDMAGKTGICPQCKGTIVVPEKHTLIKLIEKARAAHLHRKKIEELGTTAPIVAEVKIAEEAAPEIHEAPQPKVETEQLPPSEDALNVLEFSDDDLPADAPEEPPIPKCPSCNAEVAPDAIICINCGTNLQTGERLQTEAVEEPEEKADEKIDE